MRFKVSSPESARLTPHTFMDHQIQAEQYCWTVGDPALWMEMRLGKTVVAARWANQLRKPGEPILAVAPLSTLYEWRRELLREGVAASRICVLTGMPEAERAALVDPKRYSWFLTNYATIRMQTVLDRMLELIWSVIIVDESARIKNPRAAVTKNMQLLRPHARYRAILSGLPDPEDPIADVFEQLRFLDGSFMGCENYWQFRHHYFHQPDETSDAWAPRPECVRMLNDRIHARSFVMTREEAGVDALKCRMIRWVEPTDKQLKLQREILREFRAKVDGVEKHTKWAITQHGWLHRLAGGFFDGAVLNRSKIKELKRLLKGELRRQPVIIWCAFNEEVARVYEALSTSWSCRWATGKTDTDTRDQYKQDFTQGRFQVLVAQPLAFRYGIDLSTEEGTTAIYYSNRWEHETRAQSEDRIIHPKRKQMLMIIDLICRKTLDAQVLSTLKDKQANTLMNRSRALESFAAGDWEPQPAELPTGWL